MGLGMGVVAAVGSDLAVVPQEVRRQKAALAFIAFACSCFMTFIKHEQENVTYFSLNIEFYAQPPSPFLLSFFRIFAKTV